jgi:hypothetical protein
VLDVLGQMTRFSGRSSACPPLPDVLSERHKLSCFLVEPGLHLADLLELCVLTPCKDCTVISGTRLTYSKSFASVLALSACLGLACCGETTLVFVSYARSTPDVSPAGAPAPSTRSTVDEVSPP